MAIIKCKMCGGDIELSADKTYGTCDSCGSTMTFPKVDDERRANLFNRANQFRRQNEFDKAVSAYERILDGDNTDAEAHWGVTLSRFGIEYVEDPATHERIPTCHRVRSASILTDADYLAALEYAPDGYSRDLYEAEAKRIAEMQERQRRAKKAAERAAREEARRLEIQRQQEQERIQQMIARKRRGKRLQILLMAMVAICAIGIFVKTVAIPQIRYLQAEKLMEKGEYSAAIAIFDSLEGWQDSETRIQDANYLEGEKYLNAGDHSSAQKYYALAGDHPEAQQRIKLFEDYALAERTQKRGNYAEARKLFEALGDFLDAKERRDACVAGSYEEAEKKLQNNDAAGAYSIFLELGDYQNGATRASAIQEEYEMGEKLLAEGKMEEAIVIFRQLGNYAESEKKILEARKKIAENMLASGRYDEAIAIFNELNETERIQAAKDAQNAERLRLANEALEAGKFETALSLYFLLPQENEVKKQEYVLAQAASEAGCFEQAVQAYEHLGQYELSVSRLPVARYAWANQLFEQGNYMLAAEQFRILGDFADSASRINPSIYAHGKQLMESAAYDEAKNVFASLGSYEDAALKCTECDYYKAETLMRQGRYQEASTLFGTLFYADSKEKRLECEYLMADAAFAAGDYFTAQAKYESLDQYKDAADKNKTSTYCLAGAYYASGRYDDAQKLFASLGNFEDSAAMIHECRMQKALAFQKKGKYQDALKELEGIEHVNREQVYCQCNIALAEAAEKRGKTEEAILYYGKAAMTEEAQQKLYAIGKDFARVNQTEKAVETFYLASSYAPAQAYLMDIASVLESTGKTLQAYICHIVAGDNADAYFEKILAEYSCKAVIDAFGAFTIQQDDNGMRGNMLYAYSQSLQRAGRAQEAESIYDIIKGQKEVSAILYDRAVALMEAGKYDEAIEEFTDIQSYRDSAEKITLCKKNRFTGMFTPVPGMFVWDTAKEDDIEVLGAYEVYYAGEYAKDSALYPFVRLENGTSTSQKVNLTASYDGMKANYNEGTLEPGSSMRYYYGTSEIGTHTIIWYIDGVEIQSFTYTIQPGKFNEHGRMADAKVGNYITFGAYEQDNNSDNGKEPIEWLVLERQENRMLLISRYALDTQPYHNENEAVTWESCSLRQWLANDFFHAAFSAEDQAMITPVTVTTVQNPQYDTDPGNATQDRIFLLSIQEVRTYFSQDNSLMCWPTAYLKSMITDELPENGTRWWWLRSPGKNQQYASFVYQKYGGINHDGMGINRTQGGIRPAIWIDLNP